MALTERNQNIPRKTPSQTQLTPSSQSKLPRRVPTPNSAPTTIKWSSTVADRVASAEKNTNENRSPNRQRELHVSRLKKAQQANNIAANKPLPGEKPLPSRPIARLSNSLSPSKDSRSLIDAKESPLHVISVTGEKHIWPSLTPQSAISASTPASTEFADTSLNDSSPPVSPSRAARESLMAAATTLTKVITGSPSYRQTKDLASSQSSASSSYASANESSSPSQPDVNGNLIIKKTRSDQPMSAPESVEKLPEYTDLPTRQASLRQRISEGDLVSPSASSPHGFIASTHLTRVKDSSMASSDSRPHSPSPASFSRPRPGSRSSTDSRSIRTASRIPVPDTKKATVIDVKKNRLSGQSISSQAAPPTFGSRRLASPEALKILENGKMRRQLKRMAPEQNLAGARSERTWTPDSNMSAVPAETPPLSRSFDNSPAGSLAPNSPDTHPTDLGANDAVPLEQGGQPLEQRFMMPASRHQIMTDEDFEDDAPDYDSRPPPTSAFTSPLQTIPSQAVLPTYDDYKSEEAHTELSRALSCLEGGITSQNPDVDQQTLIQMFGHLKCGMENHKKTSTTLSQNAAAAEKYLAQHGSIDTEAREPEQNAEDERADGECTRHAAKASSESNRTEQRKQTMISKWSDSTPSDKDISPAAEGLTSHEPLPLIDTAHALAGSKNISDEASPADDSARVPSRINTTPPKRRETKPSEASTQDAKAPTLSRRISSPTLGNARNAKKKPGSVRVAREGMPKAIPSFSRTTMAAESKRATRKATPHSKTLIVPEEELRGRASPRTLRDSDHVNEANTKTPRSRSRSRLMLDKINGLFSGKRERKSEDLPPVPRIESHNLNGYVPIKSHPVELPAELSPTRTPRLPKMPSLSPSLHTPLTIASPATSKADDTPTTDSFSDAQSVQSLSNHIIAKAQRTTHPHRKERLLNFAKVLNDSLISAREAQISAETAQHAAKCAQMSCEMTQQSLAMLQRMAANMTRASNNRKI